MLSYKVRLKEIDKVFDLLKSYSDKKKKKVLEDCKDNGARVVLESTKKENYQTKLLRLVYVLFERELETLDQYINEYNDKIIDPLSKIMISSRAIVLKKTNALYDHNSYQLYTQELDKLKKVPRCPVSGEKIEPPVRVRIHKPTERKREKLFQCVLRNVPMLDLLSEFLHYYIPFGAERSDLLRQIVESPIWIGLFSNILTVSLLVGRPTNNLDIFRAVEGVSSPLSSHSESIHRIHLVSTYYLGQVFFSRNEIEKTIECYETVVDNYDYLRVILEWDRIRSEAKIEWDPNYDSRSKVLESFSLQELILDFNPNEEEVFFEPKVQKVLITLCECHRILDDQRKVVKYLKKFSEFSKNDILRIINVMEKFVTEYYPNNFILLRYYSHLIHRSLRISKMEKCRILFDNAETLYKYEVDNRVRGFKGTSILLDTIKKLEDDQFNYPLANELYRNIEKNRKVYSQWEDILEERFRKKEIGGVEPEIRRKGEVAVELGDIRSILRLANQNSSLTNEENIGCDMLVKMEDMLNSVISQMENNQMQIKKTMEQDWGLGKKRY